VQASAKRAERATAAGETKESTSNEANDENKETTEGGEELNNDDINKEMLEKLNAFTFESVVESMHLSPNCFIEISSDDVDGEGEAVATAVRSDVDEAVAGKDEQCARELATFLYKEALPSFVNEIRTGEALPVDGSSLTELLHARGLNMRYLGRLAELALEQEKEDFDLGSENKQRVHSMPPYFLELVETEILARSLKHVINNALSSDDHAKIAPAHAIVAILNHVLGAGSPSAGGEVPAITDKPVENKAVTAVGPVISNKQKKKKNKKGGEASAATTGSNFSVVADLAASIGTVFNRTKVVAALENEVKTRFLYAPILLKLTSATSTDANVTDTARLLANMRLSRLALLRRVCVLTGIRVASIDYNFGNEQPLSVDDIQGLLPLARASSGLQSIPKEDVCNPLVRKVVSVSQQLTADGALLHAFEVAQEAHSISQQISANISREMVMSLEQVATVLLAAGDLHQSLNTYLRVLATTAHLTGLDSMETLQQHGRVATLLMSYRKYLLSQSPSVSKQALSALSAAAMHHLVTCKYLMEFSGGLRQGGLVDVFRKMVRPSKFIDF
jgi:protein TIF31